MKSPGTRSVQDMVIKNHSIKLTKIHQIIPLIKK